MGPTQKSRAELDWRVCLVAAPHTAAVDGGAGRAGQGIGEYGGERTPGSRSGRRGPDARITLGCAALGGESSEYGME